MHAAFPRSDYYDGSAPTCSYQLTTCLPAAGLAARSDGRLQDGSHVHHGCAQRDGCPAMPLRPSGSTPQTFLPATGTGDITRPSGPTTDMIAVRLRRSQPRSASFELVGCLRSFTTLVPHVHLSVSLAGPRPSGSASPSRLCQGCSHPPRRLPAQAAPSFTRSLRRPSGAGLSPPHASMAPRGARRRQPTTDWARWRRTCGPLGLARPRPWGPAW